MSWGRRQDDQGFDSRMAWVIPVLLFFLGIFGAGVMSLVQTRSQAAEIPEIKSEVADHHEQLATLKQAVADMGGDVKDIKNILLKRGE